MRLTSFLLPAFFISMLASDVSAQTASYRVIVNPSNPVTALSKATLSRMMLKQTSKWEHGVAVVPVDLKVGSPVRESFSTGILGRTTNAVKAYWHRKIFSGKAVPPVELPNDAAVVARVLAHPGTIGYVSVKASIGKAKEIKITD